MSVETSPIAESARDTSGERAPPNSLRRLVCLSLSHEMVPNERIGAIAPADPLACAQRVKEATPVTECAVLATCNRVEVYAATRTDEEEALETALSRASETLDEPGGGQTYLGLEAVTHLHRVACGLESAVLGEDQILGQVSETFDQAREADLVGGALDRVAEAAVRAGKQCREETAIGEGEAGYGGTICRYLVESLGGPPDRVLIVGAGEMATLTAKAIKGRWETRIDIANRSEHRTLTTERGRYWPLEALEEALGSVDAVVSATGAPEPVFTERHAEHCRPGIPVIDLANPGDVSPAVTTRADIEVTGLDELTTDVRSRIRCRQEAVPAVEERIDAAIDRLVRAERENRSEDTIRGLHRKAAGIRARELERAQQRLANGEADPDVVLAEFASALLGRLLADPTEALRAAAREGDADTIAAATHLFDLEEGSEP